MRRRGFCGFELLYVILILGVLLALLVPLVQAAREKARRNTCTDQLQQLAIACQRYENAVGFLPPGEVGHGNGVFALCLPYLESADTSWHLEQELPTWLDHNLPAGSGTSWWSSPAATELCGERFEFMVCLAANAMYEDADAASRQVVAVGYANDSGKLRIKAYSIQADWTNSWAGLSTYAPSAGVSGFLRVERFGSGFGDYRQGLFTADRAMTSRRVTDGTSNTLAIGEYLGHIDATADAWTRRGCWAGALTMSTAYPLANENSHWAQFSGGHPGMVIFAFGDASVRSLQTDIDLNVLRDLSGIRDGSDNDPARANN